MFKCAGLDFVGPFKPLETTGERVSICVLSCAFTRAIILKPVEGQGAKELRHVLNTICNDYNLAPNTVVSDNAKSFKCVRTSTLYKYRKLLNKEPYIGQGPRLEWRFNASRAPWWGGFYERMMTLIKEKMARCFVGK